MTHPVMWFFLFSIFVSVYNIYMPFKKIFIFILIIGVVGVTWFIAKNSSAIKGALTALRGPVKDIVEVIDRGELPFTLQDGFTISIFADNLPNARVIILDEEGSLWVSQKATGVISQLTIKDGEVIKKEEVFTGLNKPHGIIFDPTNPQVLFIAEEDALSRVTVNPLGELERITTLPRGGNHTTRSLGFGPEGKLYISIGSTCNVCFEKNEERATIVRMNRDGSEREIFAQGLRNAVFFMWNPSTKKMWATEMGRDLLGDDLPPDEINIVEYKKNYGWPTCYGKGVHDTNFDKNVYVRNPCEDLISSEIDIPAHSSPLGLAFFPQEEVWGEYQGDLIVAYHGSWNRTVPTGYKIVRMKFSEDGIYQETEDFITGWLLKEGGTLGRPVDILIAPQGIIYISDDKAGVIYKVSYIRDK